MAGNRGLRPGGKPLEQIDALVYLNDIALLVERKDKDKVDIEAVAKLQSQPGARSVTGLAACYSAAAVSCTWIWLSMRATTCWKPSSLMETRRVKRSRVRSQSVCRAWVIHRHAVVRCTP